MRRSSFSKIVADGVLLALSACATPPNHINKVCAVFDQNDGWFDNWQAAAERASQKYSIPVPVLMATVRKESGFKATAYPYSAGSLYDVWTDPNNAIHKKINILGTAWCQDWKSVATT